mgnify:FL=1
MNTYEQFIAHSKLRLEGNRVARMAEQGQWYCLKKARKYLSQKEYAILKMRTHELRTLEETAKMFSVTRERIRQIEAKGMEKWRVNSESEEVKLAPIL